MPAFPTLSRPPSYPIDPDGQIEDAVLRSPAEGGYEQTRPRFTRMRRTWGLNYRHLSDTDVALLRTFETTTLSNGAAAFTWTHPLGAGTFTVQLAGPIRFGRPGAPLHADVSFALREV